MKQRIALTMVQISAFTLYLALALIVFPVLLLALAVCHGTLTLRGTRSTDLFRYPRP